MPVLPGLRPQAPIPRDPASVLLPRRGVAGTSGPCGFSPAGLHVTLPVFCSQRRLVSCARKARLLLFQFSQHLELWRLGSTEGTGESRGPALRWHSCSRAHVRGRVLAMTCPVSSSGARPGQGSLASGETGEGSGSPLGAAPPRDPQLLSRIRALSPPAPCGFFLSQERTVRSCPCAGCPSTSCSSRAR